MGGSSSFWGAQARLDLVAFFATAAIKAARESGVS
jgi:hypothetical protein